MSFREYLEILKRACRIKTWMPSVPAWLSLLMIKPVEWAMRDIVLTKEELRGLEQELLMSHNSPLGTESVEQWLMENRAIVGAFLRQRPAAPFWQSFGSASIGLGLTAPAQDGRTPVSPQVRRLADWLCGPLRSDSLFGHKQLLRYYLWHTGVEPTQAIYGRLPPARVDRDVTGYPAPDSNDCGWKPQPRLEDTCVPQLVGLPTGCADLSDQTVSSATGSCRATTCGTRAMGHLVSFVSGVELSP